jgi:spore coat protein U-like protein
MMNSKHTYARKGLFAAVSVLALAASGAAFGGSETANLSVGATVIDNCTISTSDLMFGNYDPIVAHAASALDGTGAVTITCTTGATAAILLGQGGTPDGSSTDAVPLRRMTDGTNFLNYFLYSNAGFTTVWGNDGTVDVEATGDGEADLHIVYGLVTAAQNVPGGSYTDTVVATVTF